jgi:glycosyltransferase involved in cell wall biosynthesis
MSECPTISVIMPTHDAEDYVADALRSILGQTVRDLEVIVVLDSCRDGTASVVAGFQATDSRVRTLEVEVGSAALARNAGIAVARAPYIALMDADDIALPERLERQLAAAGEQPEVVLWGTHMQRITDDGLPMAAVRVGCTTVDEFAALDRTKSLVRLYGTVAFFRRTDALKVGLFDPTFEPIEDAEMWDRFAELGPVLVVPEVLQLYRQHEQSLSVRKLGLQRTWFRFITQRHAARLQGRTYGLDEFRRDEARRGPLARWDDRLYSLSALYGRRFRLALARRAYLPALLAVVLMVLSHPGRFIRRLRPGAPHL